MKDLYVHPTTDALCTGAARWFLRRLAAAQAAGRTPHVALTGGSLADPFHREVRLGAPEAGVDLTRVHWWWGDERFVAGGSEERNDISAMAELLGPAGVPDSHVHRVPSSDATESVESAAALYTDALATHGVDGFEVVVLGLGPDGHVASLFPGRHQVSDTTLGAVAVHDSPKPPPLRVSLTLPVLNSARSVLFIAAGSGKSAAVAAAHQPGPALDCPARAVRGRVETGWFLDEGAASELGT
ncbi:6-phosphogluconolactonase [Nocardioides sp. Y6]|uniref:6-phosphogluconolactonase n=1 Tax=Nocardioides malaquae TaxID=2773426 RepID=A0ABR9RS21_9ACTN|nr:6-phosphogluconolactonase [Nocardioides malaquae]MBE7324373.1 6-phosphogluconolactonase [Nocardioides malaquae]